MAKKGLKKSFKRGNNSAALKLNNDRTVFYSSLAYIPTEYKEKAVWMAQSIYYAKRNSSLIVDPNVAKGYRDYDRGYIDKQKYKEMIDPKTASDSSSGTAEYVASTFESLPIDQNLDNIIRAKLEKIPHNITVKINDPVAKRQEQLDKEKIIMQREVVARINYINKELGLPELDSAVDPYKWMDAFAKGAEGDTEGASKIDVVGQQLDQIRTKIKTDDQLRMYMQYVYKNGLEIAFESAINYYYIEYNKWHLKQDAIINDLKHFNAFTAQWYTDQTTGRPVLKYLDPSTVYTSPFYEKNGDDILYWGTEYYVSFAEFEKMLGSTLDPEQKMQILDVNNMWNSTWGNQVTVINQMWDEQKKTNAQLRLGFFSVLSQESDSFGEYYIDNTGMLQTKTKDYNSPSEINKETPSKTYNVWYSCYYIPLPNFSPTQGGVVGVEGWQWLSNYVFKIQKETDMYRYGVDYRYAKSSLVIYRDNSRMSYTQIKERFMPQINTLWHKVQNCLVQDYNATIMAQDFLVSLANAVTDANEDSKDGGKKILDQLKAMKQSGLSLAQFTDKNGNKIVDDPSKFFISFKSGHIETANAYMAEILSLYNLMIQSLAISQASAGQQADPRTPAAGIEIAAEATEQARWYLEKPMIECAIMCGERVIQYVNSIVKDKTKYNYKERWDEFVDIVGLANGATIESIEDIDFENIGLTVTNENTSLQKKIVMDVLVNKVASKEITSKELALILGTSNYKLQLMEMALAEDKLQEQKDQEAEAQHQRALELQQMQIQVAQALENVKTEGKIAEINALGNVQAQLQAQINELKAQTMSMQMYQRGEQKKEDAILKNELQKDLKQNEENLKQQQAIPL